MKNDISPYSVVLMEKNVRTVAYCIYKASNSGFQYAEWLGIDKNKLDPYVSGRGRGTFVPVFCIF